MRKNPFWRLVVRRRLTLCFLILFLGTAAFGFALQAVQYLAISQEIDRLSKNYQAIGTLRKEGIDVTQGAELVEQSPYVAFVDERRYYNGVLNDIYNADISGVMSYVPTSGTRHGDVMVWAKLKEISFEERNRQYGRLYDRYKYQFEVCERIFGYPEYVWEGKDITVYWELKGDGETELPMQVGKTYLWKGTYALSENIRAEGHGDVFYLKQIEDNIWYYEEEEGKAVLETLINSEENRVQEQNRHAICAITTKDMTVMPSVQESNRMLYLREGRWLDASDQREARQVCVIHRGLADIRGLSLGDKISVTMRNDIDSAYGYVSDSESASTWDGWDKVDTVQLELEIVGIFCDRQDENDDSGRLTLGYNMLYIPDSCMPEYFSVREYLASGTYSFVLTSPEMKDTFINELREPLYKCGIELSFVENNWDAFYASSRQIEQTVRMNLQIFSAMLLLMLGIVVFLYQWQRKKEFAIARSLGIPAVRAVRWCAVPMMPIGLAGICVGVGLSWNYALMQAQKTLQGLPEEATAQISMFGFAGICAVAWIVLILLCICSMAVMAHRPVLVSLQGGTVSKKKSRFSENIGHEIVLRQDAKAVKVRRKAPAISREMRSAPQYAFASSIRFVERMMRRSVLRSCLAVSSALVLLIGLGWFRQAIRNSEMEVEHMYRSVVVEAEITKESLSTYVDGEGYIAKKTVQTILDSGYVTDSYLSAATIAKSVQLEEEDSGAVKRELKPLVQGVSDLEIYTREGAVSIQYGETYDETLFESDDSDMPNSMPPVLLPEMLMLVWDAKPGDEVVISGEKGKDKIHAVVIGSYSTANDNMVETRILVPLSVVEKMEEDGILYTKARFWLNTDRNRELDSFRQLMEETVLAHRAGILKLSYLIWDGELRQVVEPLEKNIHFMQTLYPVMLAVATFIAAGFSFLLLFQRTREAAILRVLGNTRGHVCLMLIMEQMVLSLTGLLAGMLMTGVLFKADGSATPNMIVAGLYLAGSLIGVLCGAVVVSAKKPLGMLQVKE